MKIKTKFVSFSLVVALALSGISLVKEELKFDHSQITYNDEFNKSNNPLYATYKGKDIYITNYKGNYETDDNIISIVDLRNSEENIKIISSYKINNIFEMAQIIDIILEYNKNNPSNPLWIRSKSSLINEWLAHNGLYMIDFEGKYISHTEDVDFENNEEKRYLLFK